MANASADTDGAAVDSERRFRAMNTDVHVVVVASGTAEAQIALATAEQAVHDREARWSRFLPESELSILNRSCGRPVIVAEDTFGLVCRAIDAWQLTGGVFDPTVGASLLAAGYDRSFELVTRDDPPRAVPSMPAATPAGIELHDTTNSIVLPEGVTLDLGGIAKGATCDAIVDELMGGGVLGCCINIGGDLRVAGRSPDPRGWTVTLDCPGSSEVRAITVGEGAVCTSTTTKRRWRTTGGYEHHLRNAATGAKLDTGLVSASVIAATAQQAEVLAKVAIAAGPLKAADALSANGVTGVVVHDSGVIDELPGFDGFRLQGCVRNTTQPDGATPTEPIGDAPAAAATTERVASC